LLLYNPQITVVKMFLSKDQTLSKAKLFLLRLGEKRKKKEKREKLPKEEVGFSD